MILRPYSPSDCAELVKLFHDTVHAVNSKDYSPEQLDAWAPKTVDLKKWNDSLQFHHTLVAVIDGKIVGFGDIDDTGYLDRLFVHKDFQRRGIATALCDALEKTPSGDITVHASITARPFFTQRGYRVICEQQVVCRGVLFTNFKMKKAREILLDNAPIL